MKLELSFKANTYVDFAIGLVIKGKESQVFQEYFPAVSAVLQELEMRTIVSYAVLDSNLKGDQPEQGALSFFRKVENYNTFLQDPRVKKVLHLRDEGMIFLNDGNMFEATGHMIKVDTDSDYALVLSSDDVTEASPLIEMKINKNSPNKAFGGRTLSIHNWSDKTAKLMNSNSDSVTVLRIRFFPRG
ncbi:MAG: hypothetical protein MI974_34220 [Chitinophagales bacterium]|nr:hypothetical protein [Chitinophagales bacterium]